MARSQGSIRPVPMIAVFCAIAALVYALMLFSGDHKKTPKLGIDLQGGTSVTLTARTPDGGAPDRTSLQQAQEIIETRVNGLGVAGSEVLIDGNNLVITVPGNDGTQARSLGQTARLFIRQVITSQPRGAAITSKAKPESKSPEEVSAEIKLAKTTRQSNDENVVKEALKTLDCSKQDPLRGNDDPKLPLVTCASDGTAVYYLAPSLIDGQEIDNASSTFDAQQAEYQVSLMFKPKASEAWAKFTAENIGQQAAFTLDSQVVSAPVVRGATPAGSATSITGNFTGDESRQLANSLKYGSLPLSFESSDANTVSATLGLESLKAGLLAGLVGLVAVLLYCLAYYRALGILTALSLVASGVVVYGILVLLGRWIGFTLDLAGIAGLIIGIGMTADSFVVFFERIKDEMREGRSFRSAVPRGWVRARRTILSGNAVSFIASAVLYALAAGQVRGFAFTLGLTTILDVIVLFLVTSPLLHIVSSSKFWAKPSVNGLGAVQQVAREIRQRENAALVQGGAR